MAKKINGLCFLAGAGVSKYYADKVSRKKDYELERKNSMIEILDRWMTLRDKGVSIEKYLVEKKCKKVAIYGMGMIGNHLYEELKTSEIEIVGMDRSDIYNNFQMPVYKPDDCPDHVDLIIVTPLEYKKICENLGGRNGQCISFQQLLNDCEEYLKSYD